MRQDFEILKALISDEGSGVPPLTLYGTVCACHGRLKGYFVYLNTNTTPMIGNDQCQR